MNKTEFTGGARIGMANASFPFATLKVTENNLTLNASIIGNLTFQPKDIISIEPYTKIPLIGRGVKIIHRVPDYKEIVIFWSFKNPQKIIQEIKATGFLENINTNISEEDILIVAKQKQGGFPIKKPFKIGAIILWNILFLIDFYRYYQNGLEGTPVGIGITSALGILFLCALLTLLSSSFRALILKEGRGLADIKKFLYLILFISGTMLINFIFLFKMFI